MRHDHIRMKDEGTTAETLPPDQAWRVLPEGLVEALAKRGDTNPPIAVDRLVFSLVTAFRAHPHINNVMTHISRGSWVRVEVALRELVDPAVGSASLSPLARNLVDLCCAERGVTGRIMKPFVEDLLVAALGRAGAAPISAIMTAHFLNLRAAESARAAARSCSRWP